MLKKNQTKTMQQNTLPWTSSRQEKELWWLILFRTKITVGAVEIVTEVPKVC